MNSVGGRFSEKKANEHIAGLKKLVNMDGFRPTKWIFSDLRDSEVISTGEKLEQIRQMYVFPTTVERNPGIQLYAKSDIFVLQLSIPSGQLQARRFLHPSSPCMNIHGLFSLGCLKDIDCAGKKLLRMVPLIPNVA